MRESGWDLRDSGVADRLTRRVNEGDERGTNAVHRGGACVLALIFFLSVFSFANSLHRVKRWTTAKCAIKGFCDCVIAKSPNFFLFECSFLGVRRTHLFFPG